MLFFLLTLVKILHHVLLDRVFRRQRFTVFLLLVLAGLVPTSAVVSQDWQAPMVGEGHEGSAASGLAFVVDVAKGTVAAIDAAPDIAVR